MVKRKRVFGYVSLLFIFCALVCVGIVLYNHTNIFAKIAPKEYILDENLEITFSVDAGRVPDAELNSVLTTKALVAQAKVAVFQSKIKEAILGILEEIRTTDNDFEKESEIIL